MSDHKLTFCCHGTTVRDKDCVIGRIIPYPPQCSCGENNLYVFRLDYEIDVRDLHKKLTRINPATKKSLQKKMLTLTANHNELILCQLASLKPQNHLKGNPNEH